jgi:hypothetical protein
MKLGSAVFLAAGLFVVIFTLLSMYVNGSFIYGTLVVGVMLIQTSFTGFCPARIILKSLGFKE